MGEELSTCVDYKELMPSTFFAWLKKIWYMSVNTFKSWIINVWWGWGGGEPCRGRWPHMTWTIIILTNTYIKKNLELLLDEILYFDSLFFVIQICGEINLNIHIIHKNFNDWTNKTTFPFFNKMSNSFVIIIPFIYNCLHNKTIYWRWLSQSLLIYPFRKKKLN